MSPANSRDPPALFAGRRGTGVRAAAVAAKGGQSLMNKLIWAPALCLALGAAGAAHAAPQVDADPSKDYLVGPELGPWMVCAAYFTGPAAPDLARQLVLQIRTCYGTPAYVFNYADEERKKQREAVERQQQSLPADAPADGSDYVVPIPRHHAVVRVEEQCAVMIGGYADENTAHTALLAVRKWPTPELKAPDGISPFGSVYDHGKEIALNPFATQSMVVRNPAVPHDNAGYDFNKDKFLKTLNADEEYSMLQCPGKYTLVVKEYVGAASVKQQEAEPVISGKWFGLGRSKDGETLALAANNAHELAKTMGEAMKKAGIPVYVLHTRTSSVVSIGAFSGPDDRSIQAVTAEFDLWRKWLAQRQPDPSKGDPLGLFPTPVLKEVPRP